MDQLTSAGDTGTVESTQQTPVGRQGRWWLQVGIGGFRIRGLLNSDAERTFLIAVGLQIAAAIGKKVLPLENFTTAVANGRSLHVTAQVELPFNIRGVQRYITCLILPELC